MLNVLYTLLFMLDEKHILLNRDITNKKHAIKTIATFLEQEDLVRKNFAKSMLKREKQANTFLSSGIAIPHCDRDGVALINKTAVVVLRPNKPLLWDKGNPVDLIFGIAAESDEHLAILGRLTDLLSAPDTLAQLKQVETAAEFCRLFVGEVSKDKPAVTAIDPEIQQQWDALAHKVEVVCEDKVGLHARPASLLLKMIKAENVDCLVAVEGKMVKVTGVVSLLKLGVASGTRLEFASSSEKLLEQIAQFFKDMASAE